MKPEIDRELCIGCGLCEDLCPEVFELREDGYAYVLVESPDPELYGCTRDAADSCPVDAIAIAE